MSSRSKRVSFPKGITFKPSAIQEFKRSSPIRKTFLTCFLVGYGGRSFIGSGIFGCSSRVSKTSCAIVSINSLPNSIGTFTVNQFPSLFQSNLTAKNMLYSTCRGWSNANIIVCGALLFFFLFS